MYWSAQIRVGKARRANAHLIGFRPPCYLFSLNLPRLGRSPFQLWAMYDVACAKNGLIRTRIAKLVN